VLALTFDLTEDYLERRAPHRDEHLALARAAHERGELLLAGAFSEPADKSLFVWATDDESVIERFIAADPYVKNQVVTGWQIRHWNVAVGA
jgi:uncharacterized protein YciI